MTVIPLAERIIPQTARAALAPAHTALLLWDLQRGLAGQALYVEELSRRWLALRDAARARGVLIIRTRHVAVPHELMADSELWRVMRKQDVVSPTDLNPYMQRGSADVEFLPGLEPGPDEVVVEKTTPSLFVGTTVSAVLHAAGVRTLALAGVATDIGIDFTARHALALGFFPVVIEDAVGAYSDSAQSTGLQSLRRFAFCADTMTAIDSWRIGHV